MRSILKHLLLFCFCITTAFAQNAPATNAQPAAARPEHTLGPGDVIRVAVYQNPDLTVETRLSENGQITFPLVGNVSLDGLTATAAEQKIAKALRDGNFVLKPQVTVSLLQVRSAQISILGQVAKPGRYPIETVNSKVSEMIAAAGGVAPGGSDVVTLVGTRGGKPVRIEIDLPAILQGGKNELDMVVNNNDIIYVDRAPQLYIYGEVQHPGVARLERGMTVLQALAQAGGLTQRGTDRGLKIHRRDASGATRIIQPNMNDMVERDDVIYVKESLF
jgi:polysaccharide export outer membrane protein